MDSKLSNQALLHKTNKRIEKIHPNEQPSPPILFGVFQFCLERSAPEKKNSTHFNLALILKIF